MTSDDFTRDAIQAGGLFRVRKARALLYLIEQEARRVADQRAVVATSAPEAGSMLAALVAADPETMRADLPGEADAAYIESFRNARRYAAAGIARMLASTVDSWKVLLPDDLPTRAEVLHQMALRHALPANRCQAIGTAFGVGTAAFDSAYSDTVGAEVSSAFSEPVGFIKWLRSRS